MRVGGQTYRVVATGDDHRVQHLAELVDRKLAEVLPNGLGRSVTAQQAMFLTAMALAAEVEEQRARATTLEGERDRSLHLAGRARDVVARLLERVDGALASVTPPAPAVTTPSEARPSREASFPSAPARRSLPDPEVIEDEALLDLGSPMNLRSSDDPSTDPLARLTDPPDAIHESLLVDLMTPPPPTLRREAPVNTTRSPGVATKSAPAAAPAPAHRGGLRLIRQAGSPPDDDSR